MNSLLVMKILMTCICVLMFYRAAFSFEIQGSTSAALGGAGVGSVNAVDGGFVNPAAIGLFERNSASLGFANKGFRIYFADNGSDSIFPAAIAYTQSDLNGIKTKNFQLILAQAIQSKFAFAINIQPRETRVDNVDQTYRQTFLDLAALFKPIENWSLGFAFKNKPTQNTELNDFIDNNPSLVFGVEYSYLDLLFVKTDIESAQNAQLEQKQTYKVGLETHLNEWLILRLGYQNSNILGQNYGTAGLGIGTSNYGLHYAYVKESNLKKDAYHSVDLTMPF